MDIFLIYLIGLSIVGIAMVFHPATSYQTWLGILISLIFWPITMILMFGWVIDRKKEW